MSHEVSLEVDRSPLPTRPRRPIVLRAQGRQHGPIRRVVSPSDLGELIKPFVFLDYFEFEPTPHNLFGMHPHSGIATITWLLEGGIRYEDTTGKSGRLPVGSVEWMRAGSGVWHDGSMAEGDHLRGLQLWIALPAEFELAPADSQYMAPSEIPAIGPARLAFGSYEGVTSPTPSPAGMNYLSVNLKKGETWTYTPPRGHDVGWLYVHEGTVQAAGESLSAELAVFEESEDAIRVTASTDAGFVLGSARKHPHDLVLGRYSVHTSREALAAGESGIAEIGALLRRAGRI